jgi:hypothetical protein
MYGKRGLIMSHLVILTNITESSDHLLSLKNPQMAGFLIGGGEKI